MKKYIALTIIFTLTIPFYILAQQSDSLSAEQKLWLTKSFRTEKAGWIYLHLEGNAQERGFQHGYLLAKEINEAIQTRVKVWNYQTAMDWLWLVRKAGEMFTPKVDSELVDEINGMVDGMKAAKYFVTRDELITLNGFFELAWYWWPTVKDSISPNAVEPKKQSCSSFIATGSMTIDGKIVLGHNSMVGFPESDCNIVLDILPDSGHRILMQTFTGWIHSGTDFFVTDAGLVGSETTIGGFFPFDTSGVPEFSRMRHATQYANNIEEWCEIMKNNNNGGYANAWLLGDIKTNEIARLELGLKCVGFEKKTDGYFTGSNIAEDLKLLRFETHADNTNIKYSSIARRVRWNQLMKEYKGKINLETAKLFEADHFDTYLKMNNPGGRSLCGHDELDPRYSSDGTPYDAGGSIDGKVLDATIAKEMSFAGRWGSSCGTPFDAKKYLEVHPQFGWMSGLIKDRPSQPWVVFKSGDK
ncbi:MAG: phospholipase [Ignavibacteriales bacterium]|nr:phospholipase [Ignavibacteriales bacterium]